ncbi:MAG: hypothetical protein U0183_12905 [Polyangiaceae bacterium]
MPSPSERSRKGPLALTVLGALVVAIGLGVASQKPEAPPARAVALGQLQPVSMPDLKPGEEIVLRGSVRTTFDGTVYDALSRVDTTPAGTTTRRGGLFEPETSGFRVASYDPATHEAHLVVTGTSGSACASLGVAAPCLVPLVREAAQERLLTEAELRATLQGAITADVPLAPPVGPPASRTGGLVASFFGLLLLLSGIVAWVSAARTSPMAAVRRAAKKALGETRGDRAHATVRAKIDELLHHAEKLDAVRKTTAARLAKLDVVALEEKARRLVNQGAADDVRQWAERELSSALEVRADHEKAVLGLGRVESALGVVALAAREEKGVRVDDAVREALGEIDDELAIREAALAEADELVAKLPPKRA